MRITPNATAYNALYNIQQGRAKLDALQEDIASGLNVNRPSDDPVATSMLLSANDQLQDVEQYSSNITKTNTWLSMTSTALTGIADILTNAKSLVSSIASGTSDTTQRDSVVTQLTSLREQLADIGNTQYQGQYIFSGSKTSTKPFSQSVGNSSYSGDLIVNSIAINTSATEKMNVTGDRVLTSTTGVNILKTMDNLITAVKSNDVSGIQSGAQDLKTGADQVTGVQTEVALRTTRLASESSMLKITKNTLDTIIGNTQNADYAKLAVELTQQQTAFQASLSATAKITQLSLLDYMS